MIYCCVECNIYWCSKNKYNSLDTTKLDLENTDISHGICPICLSKRQTGKIHLHQRRKGYNECFNRNENCSDSECLFFTFCGQRSIDNWLDQVIIVKAGKK